MAAPMQPLIRRYRPSDEQSWLRCRVLSFLSTAYYDDVKRAKTPMTPTDIELVAVVGDEVVAVLDVEVVGAAATIDTVAVHPDHQQQGLATRLLDQALAELDPSVQTLDAWTREDAAANAWYQRSGFVENFRYVHVHAKDGDLPAVDGHPIVHAFLHARIEEESAMRAQYDRVYICRQYLRSV